MNLNEHKNEILRDYHTAADKYKQVQILADMYLVKNKEMAQFLADNGEDVDKRYLAKGRKAAPAVTVEADADEVVGQLDELISTTPAVITLPVDDPVNHPAHYTDGTIEVIDFIEDKGLDFCRGNTVKYICRAGKKDPDKELEDLEKAEWYLRRSIESLKRRISWKQSK